MLFNCRSNPCRRPLGPGPRDRWTHDARLLDAHTYLVISALFASCLALAAPSTAVVRPIRAASAGLGAPLNVATPLFTGGLPGPLTAGPSGSFTTIYRLDTPDGPLALKIPHNHAPGEARFLSEAELTREVHARFHDSAQAQHAPAPENFNLAKLVGYGSLERVALPGAPASDARMRQVEAMVLEWVTGQRLGDFINGGGRITAADWQGFKDGVARLNALGYVHNDIKDENILARRDPDSGRVVLSLIDFGIMKKGSPQEAEFSRRLRLEAMSVRVLEDALAKKKALVPPPHP